MKQKILGLSFICLSIIGGLSLFLENENLINLDSKKTTISSQKTGKNIYINNIWKKDFQRLLTGGELPQAWTMINQIIFIPTDPLTKELSSYLKAPVKINSKGTYRLEITVITHQSEKNKTQILLQHNLIDSENENTVWELNKTYNLTSN